MKIPILITFCFALLHSSLTRTMDPGYANPGPPTSLFELQRTGQTRSFDSDSGQATSTGGQSKAFTTEHLSKYTPGATPEESTQELPNTQADSYAEPDLFHCESNEQCRQLLEAGADVNARNDMGETALFECWKITDTDFSIETDKVIERYRLLLDAHADVNARCKLGYTVLLEEIEIGNPRICEYLLSRGACVNIKTNNGITPLLAAASQRNKVICKMLVSHLEEIDRGLIAALHYLKHIKNPFLRFLYRERTALLRPHLQHGTLAALLMQTNEYGKWAYDLFHLRCLVPRRLQFLDEDSANDSE